MKRINIITLCFLLVACGAEFDEVFDVPNTDKKVVSNVTHMGKYGGYLYEYKLCNKKDFYSKNSRQCVNITSEQYNNIKNKIIGQ